MPQMPLPQFWELTLDVWDAMDGEMGRNLGEFERYARTWFAF